MNWLVSRVSVCLLVLISILGGCAANPRHQAVDALLHQRMAQLSDGDLLRAYYELRRRAQELGIDEAQLTRMSGQYARYSRIDRAFGATRSANENLGGAVAMAIVAGIAKAHQDAVVSKAVEARVELELRGWTPVLGFTRTTPQQQQATQYIQRGPISEGVSPQSGPSEQPSIASAAAPQPSAVAATAAPQPSVVAASPVPVGSDRPCHQMAVTKDGTLQCAR